MRYILLLLTGCCLMAMTDKPAYRLYDQKLKSTTYAKLLRQAAEADVVFFGELHNNPICHWLQLQLTKDLYAEKKGQLVLAAEMFETDNQQALTDYVQGKLTDKEFAAQARLWQNYTTDYRPIVDFARANNIPFVASNVPRRLASTVAKQGLAALDALPSDDKKLMMPLPLEVDLNLPGYKAMLDMMGTHGGSGSTSATAPPTDPAKHPAANFARAQAIKDATMAHFSLQDLKPGQLLLHFNGDYHSKNFEGIVWYMHKQRPELKIFTISSVELTDLDKLSDEYRNRANVLLAIPADMTKTY